LVTICYGGVSAVGDVGGVDRNRNVVEGDDGLCTGGNNTENEKTQTDQGQKENPRWLAMQAKQSILASGEGVAATIPNRVCWL
jgi:hypothetical protein